MYQGSIDLGIQYFLGDDWIIIAHLYDSASKEEVQELIDVVSTAVVSEKQGGWKHDPRGHQGDRLVGFFTLYEQPPSSYLLLKAIKGALVRAGYVIG